MSKTNNFSFTEIKSFIINHMYLLLFLPLVFIISPMLAPGVVLFGDFPLLESSLYSYKYLSTWNEFGSHYSFETLPRYPFIVFGYFLNNIHIGGDVISKLFVILGFSVASFSFYFSFIHFMRTRLNNYGSLLRIGAIIGSLFYAYNVWSFHRIHHWYLWIGYAFLPIFLMLLNSGIKYPIRWNYVISAVLLWTLVSGYPHMVIFYGLFYLGFSIFFVVRAMRNKESVLNATKPILLIIVLYILINIYWIYPYLLYTLYSGEVLAPSIYVTEEYTKHLSADSNFLNVLRLLEDTWRPTIIDVKPSEESLMYSFWVTASFVFPILAFSSLLLKKKSKYVLAFSIIGIVGIFLALGTNAPNNFYLIFLFDFPLSSTLRFILREPDKWAFLIALSYSFLLGIFSFEFLKKVKSIKHGSMAIVCFLLLIFSSFILYSYPTYNSTSKEMLDPVVLPSEYDSLNEYLQNTDSDKVFYLTQDFTPKKWNKERYFCCLDEISSVKPNIDTYLPASENYHNYLTSTILNNKSNNLINLVFPLGTTYLIYSNDELYDIPINDTKLLEKLSSFKDVTNIKDIGFFKLYRAGENKNIGELHIPNQIMLLNGGLDAFTSLNSIPSFSTVDSSMIFLDQSLGSGKKYELINSADYLALGKESHDFTFSFIDNKYVISPYDFSNHGGLTNAWSKDSAMSLGYGMFHLRSADLGIESWNFDYGEGLVITETPGTKLTIPIEIENSNNKNKSDNSTYTLFMRYLKNQKGGSVNIKFDDNILNEIDTFDKISNNLVWEQVGIINTTKGKHKLTLENVAGFNAINIFALIHPDELDRISKESNQLLGNKSRLVYVMEAESNLYNNKGKDTGISQSLFNETYYNNKASFNKIISGQFKTPENTDLALLQFSAENRTDINRSYTVRNLKIIPEHLNYSVFTSSFDTKNDTIQFEDLEQQDWVNKDVDFLSISETNGSMEEKSLKVDIKAGNLTHWSVISTDYIPVNENAAYNFSLGVSAKDVNQLHSKIYFFDSNKTEISSDFIFGGKDGTFKGNFSKVVSSPSGAKYSELQMWVKPNTTIGSTYSLDNLILTEISRESDWVNKDVDFLSISETNRLEEKSLRVDIKQGNLTHWSVISTDYIPVNENAAYNFSLGVSAKDVNQLHSKIYYFDDNKNMIQLKGREDFVFDGRDDSFNQEYSKFVLPSLGTKYIQLQLWVKPNNDMSSSYILNNVKINEIPPSITYNNNFINFENIKSEDEIYEISGNISLIDTNESNTNFGSDEALVKFHDGKANSTNVSVLQTKPFSVEENRIYNYSMTLEGGNLTSVSSIVSFRNSSDVIQESNKYGNNASNGRVISMSSGSEVFTKFDVIKPSNYTIALRAYTCGTCTFLELELSDDNYDNRSTNMILQPIHISLKNEDMGLKWLNSNVSFPLERGKYELRVRSDTESALDSIVIYSNNSDQVNVTDHSNMNKKNTISSLTNFFSHEGLQPAYVSEYEKISPTQYTLDIRNATRPFIVSFAEAYDNQWVIRATDSNIQNDVNNSDFKTSSIPIYSFVNGFFINKTGDYTLTIEYSPQQWFYHAGVISLFVLVVTLVVYFTDRHWQFLRGLKNHICGFFNEKSRE